ncbi:MAG: T9SS type A sorting domain-containing protein [Saprospiraceae bacterium]
MRLLIVFFFGITYLFAQRQDYRWMLGSPDGTPYGSPKFGGMDLDFNQGYVKLVINHKPFYMNSHNASICDEKGELLFYTDGCYLTDAHNKKITGGDSLNPIYNYYENCVKEGRLYPGGLDYPQGGIILPKPGTKNRYYYFSLEDYLGKNFAFSPHVLCTEVEYRKDSVVPFIVLGKNLPVCKDTFPVGSMIAISKSHGDGYWIVIRKDRSNVFYTLDVAADSIRCSKKVIGEYYQYTDLGVAAFSPDGKKYAFYAQEFGLELMDFDRESGTLANYQKIHVLDTIEGGGYGGVCFSPNSQFLYVATAVDLFQYNIQLSDIKSSEKFIGHINLQSCNPGRNNIASFGPMVLGPDCRIYMVSNYQQKCMNMILNPNGEGSDCGFVQQAIRLPYLNHSSIPNFPHYRIDEPYPCDSSIRFELSVLEDFDFTKSIMVFPNPAKEQIHIGFPSALQYESMILVYDARGNLLDSKIIPRTTEDYLLNCSELASGIYFFQIKSSNGAYASGKFVVN